MWIHYENGITYNEARCAIATCDMPDGNFVYHGNFYPYGNILKDCYIAEKLQGGLPAIFLPSQTALISTYNDV